MATYRNFNHEMRGRPSRCDLCGGPLLLGVRDRCIPCRIFPDRAREVFGASSPSSPSSLTFYPDLPPLILPSLPTLRDADEQQRLVDKVDNTAAPAGDLRSLREQEEDALWARVEGDKPAFPLDRRCAMCCRIMTEYAHPPYIILAAEAGYRCPAHSGARLDRYKAEVAS